MTLSRININPENLTWAIRRAGFDEDDFLEKHPKVREWIDGKEPTVKQLEKFAHEVFVPFGYLFLDEHPKEELPIPFFRTVSGHHQFDINIYDTLLSLVSRQQWLSEYLESNGIGRCGFIGKYSIHDSASHIADEIHHLLDLPYDWAFNCKDQGEAIRTITKALENIGCTISFLSQVGFQSSRKISVENCRGFALVDERAPFIFVNNNDANTAQMFTLIHEFAHLLIGYSAGTGSEETLDKTENENEDFCDAVAARFLLEENTFRDKWNEKRGKIDKVAKMFKVSRLATARRALEINLLSREDFFRYNQMLKSEPKKESKQTSGGGDPYKTVKKRVGYTFLIHIRNAIRSNMLLYNEAYRLTGINGHFFNKLITEQL